MPKSGPRFKGRRRFLKYLAASPAFTWPQSTLRWAGKGDGLIASPDDAIDVFDFEALARDVLPAAHWGYLATGTDDDSTIDANRDGFDRFQLRPRRLVDIRTIDTSTEVFGKRWRTPIAIAPTGGNGAFHTDAELGVTRAAREKNHLQMLSTVASTSVEDVVAERGEPVWFQLYPIASWDATRRLVDRAESAGCPALVFTVDLHGGSNRLTNKRFAKLDSRECTVCHIDGGRNTPNYEGIGLPEGQTPEERRASRREYIRGLTWDFVRRLKDHTSMKVLVKGIVTAEDARIAIDTGIDGLIVSNHGGRAENSLRSTIESLPEVVDAVQKRVPVLVDGGFRRGVDVFKALALGADTVCIGRPYLWGLASFGQAGVEAVLEMLTRELEIVMGQMGATSIPQIGRGQIAERD